MSIYATLWNLQFPRTGQYYLGCGWIEVCGQGVPGHIGTPTAGFGYETGDPFAEFLPPAIDLEGEDDERMRAVVIVTSETCAPVNPWKVPAEALLDRLCLPPDVAGVSGGFPPIARCSMLA